MHSKGVSTAGHNLLGKAIRHHLIAAGMSVTPEVEHLRPNRKTRPDFLISDGNNDTFLTDHTIINPLARSRLNRPIHAVEEQIARDKTNKYAEDAKNLEATFVPLVFSVFGHAHPKVLDLLRFRIAQYSDVVAELCGSSGMRDLINTFIAACSCAVQKRNAFIVHLTAQRIKAKAGAPAPQAMGIP